MQKACRGSHGALVLEAARANGDIVSARKGDAGYTLTARGHSAHAGVEVHYGAEKLGMTVVPNSSFLAHTLVILSLLRKIPSCFSMPE